MNIDHPFADDLGFLLSRASGIVARSASETLEPLGLRVRSYSVLAFASEDEAGVTQRNLASSMALDPSQIVALVDELEQRGWVTRTPDPADRRNKLIVATDEGRHTYDQARQQVEDSHKDYFADLPQHQLDELRRMLRQVAFPEFRASQP